MGKCVISISVVNEVVVCRLVVCVGWPNHRAPSVFISTLKSNHSNTIALTSRTIIFSLYYFIVRYFHIWKVHSAHLHTNESHHAVAFYLLDSKFTLKRPKRIGEYGWSKIYMLANIQVQVNKSVNTWQSKHRIGRVKMFYSYIVCPENKRCLC